MDGINDCAGFHRILVDAGVIGQYADHGMANDTKLTTLPCERSVGDHVRGLADQNGWKLIPFVKALATGWGLLTPQQQMTAFVGQGIGPLPHPTDGSQAEATETPLVHGDPVDPGPDGSVAHSPATSAASSTSQEQSSPPPLPAKAD